MRELKKKRIFLLVCLLGAFVLPACSAGGEDPAPDPDVTTLIYAKLSDQGGVDRESVDRFNRGHEGVVQIEVRNYSKISENGRSGIDLLLTEIAAGNVPDIIELGTDGQTCQLPYRRMAERGYLEDLWPWIENDPDLGREAVMEAPLKAAEVNGGLYTVFDSVFLQTLTGAESVVGDRTSWTVEDMMEALASMPEGAVILDNRVHMNDSGKYVREPSMRKYLFSSLLYASIGTFVDWESGQCSFDSQEFRSYLELAGSIPDAYEWTKDYGPDKIYSLEEYDEAYSEEVKRMLTGMVMLEDLGYRKIYNLSNCNFYFGGRAAIVGYPVADGSVGSYFRPRGIKLAMSSACQDKEAAWEYIRQTLLPKQLDDPALAYDAIPVNRKAYEAEWQQAIFDSHSEYIDGEFISIGTMRAAECRRFTEVFNSTTKCSLLLETDILKIIDEVAGAYFAGDKTLDETVDLIQRRVTLYVNEQK